MQATHKCERTVLENKTETIIAESNCMDYGSFRGLRRSDGKGGARRTARRPRRSRSPITPYLAG